jgi:hypothetical protein
VRHCWNNAVLLPQKPRLQLLLGMPIKEVLTASLRTVYYSRLTRFNIRQIHYSPVPSTFLNCLPVGDRQNSGVSSFRNLATTRMVNTSTILTNPLSLVLAESQPALSYLQEDVPGKNYEALRRISNVILIDRGSLTTKLVLSRRCKEGKFYRLPSLKTKLRNPCGSPI